MGVHDSSDIIMMESCPFCGCEKIRLGANSSATYNACCMDCGCRSKSIEVPDYWPPEDWKGPDPQAQEESEYRNSVALYCMRQAAKLWNARVGR